MVAVSNLSYEDLVFDRPDTFQVQTNLDMDREVFEAEVRNIFERTWVYVAHASRISAAGDDQTSIIGPRPIVVGHQEGQVQVPRWRLRVRAGRVAGRSA
jgi:hypothetical protein